MCATIGYIEQTAAAIGAVDAFARVPGYYVVEPQEARRRRPGVHAHRGAGHGRRRALHRAFAPTPPVPENGI
jgi:hypothetical protein